MMLRSGEGNPRMPDTPTFGRYAEIPFDRMTPEQQEGYRFLVDGPRGRLPGPYKVWVHNPKLVHAAEPLGQHFTPGASSLTEREREIAVVVITSKWHSAYPNNAHEKRGKEVGLPAAAGGGDHRRIADLVRGCARAGGVRGGDGAGQRAACAAGTVRSRGEGARAREHHRHDRADGLLHVRVADDEFYAVPAGSPGLAR